MFRHFASTILISVLLLINFCYLRLCWSHTVGLEVFCSLRFGVRWALSLRCLVEFTGEAIWACGFPCGISNYGFNVGNSIGWFQFSRSSNVSFRKLLKKFVHFFWCLKTALLTQQKKPALLRHNWHTKTAHVKCTTWLVLTCVYIPETITTIKIFPSRFKIF